MLKYKMIFKTGLKMTAGILALNTFKNSSKSKVFLEEQNQLQRNAICLLFPEQAQDVHGIVSFHQKSPNDKIMIVANV